MSHLLYSLLPSGRRLVTPELASGQLALYPEEDCAAFMVPLERDIDLGAFDGVVADALSRLPSGDSSTDAHLAVELHRALPLSRREAAEPGVFRYLSVVRHPALVRHRWEYRSYSTMRTRFWRAGTRHDANAFSRWWWIAELTRDGEDYALTNAVLARSALSTHIFSRTLAHYRPAVAMMVDVLAEQPGALIEATVKNFGKMLSVRVLEALEEAELRTLLIRAMLLAAESEGRGEAG